MIPRKLDEVAVPAGLQFFRFQYNSLTVELHLLLQKSFFPFLQIADQTSSAANIQSVEKPKHNHAARPAPDRKSRSSPLSLSETEDVLDHPCIIEYHQRTLRQIIRNMLEYTLADFSFFI